MDSKAEWISEIKLHVTSSGFESRTGVRLSLRCASLYSFRNVSFDCAVLSMLRTRCNRIAALRKQTFIYSVSILYNLAKLDDNNPDRNVLLIFDHLLRNHTF